MSNSECNINHCPTVKEMGENLIKLELKIQGLKKEKDVLLHTLRKVKELIEQFELYNELTIELFYTELEYILDTMKSEE